ncbi:MAG: hypothetical protein DCC49_13835 [Acidobacteria bacterium]|nr:MAG: hypothetical protein DCC49_13835 [Acidobacteriota bacterium]
MSDLGSAGSTSVPSAATKFKSPVLSALLLTFMVLVFACVAIGARGVWRQYAENKGDEGIVDFIPSISLLAFAGVAFAVVAVSTLKAVVKGASDVRQLVVLATVPATALVSVAIVGSSARKSAATLALMVGVISVCIAATLVAFLTRVSNSSPRSRSTSN